MNYQEIVGSDTEEEILTSKKPEKKISDEEDEFKIEESDDEARVGEGDGNTNTTGKRRAKIYDSEDYSGESSGEEEDLDDIGNSDEDDEEGGESEDEESSKKCEIKPQKSVSKPNSNAQNSPKDKSGKVVKFQTHNSNKVGGLPKVTNANSGKRTIQAAENAENVVKDNQENDSNSISEDKKKDLLSGARFSTSTSNAVKSGLVGPPPLKIRVSKGGLASLTSPIKGETSGPPNQPPPSLSQESIGKNPSVLPGDKSQTTVSEGLRQKLHNALTKKIKSQISDQRDLSEELSDEEEEEEDLDEEISDFDEDDFPDSGEDEGKLEAPFTGLNQKAQNLRTPQKFPVVPHLKAGVKVEEKDEKSGAPGIRVISPLKLLANPPPAMEQTRFPMAHNPQQVQMMRSPMPPMQPMMGKMGGIDHGGAMGVGAGAEVSPPKRRGRGRGKKQLALEKAAQEQLAMDRGGQDQQQQKIPPQQQQQQSPLAQLKQQQAMMTATSPQMAGGSVIRGMLQTGQPPPPAAAHGFPPAGRQSADQMPPRPDARFANMPKGGRMPFPVQGPPFAGSQAGHRMIRPPYHSTHRPLDPSPSGGGAINVQPSKGDSSQPPAPTPPPAASKNQVSSSQEKSLNAPHPAQPSPAAASYMPPRPPGPGMRFPVPDSNRPPPHNYMSSAPNLPPRPAGNFPPYQQAPPPPPSNYHYSGYSGISNVDEGMSPFMEPQYAASASATTTAAAPEGQPDATETSSSKSTYDEDASGGEFGGLVSYFSSQREEDGLDT